MNPADDLAVTDPERIRAMAHPIRLELLDVLHELGEATATQCAQRLGESVASCSFHLRSLEKHGYVERAEPRGREKPWRVTHRSLRTAGTAEVPGSLHASSELGRLSFDRQAQRLSTALDRLPHDPQEWVDATSIMTSSVWATAEEAADLARQIVSAVEALTGRHEDPTLRPEGARRVHLLATVFSDPPATADPPAATDLPAASAAPSSES